MKKSDSMNSNVGNKPAGKGIAAAKKDKKEPNDSFRSATGEVHYTMDTVKRRVGKI